MKEFKEFLERDLLSEANKPMTANTLIKELSKVKDKNQVIDVIVNGDQYLISSIFHHSSGAASIGLLKSIK